MAMQKNSFANRIRTAVKALAAQGQTCDTKSISIQAMLTELVDNKRMLNALRDQVKAGELVRVSPGVYALAPKAAEPAQPELRQVMWRILRMRRLVTADDLMEMAGACRGYAQEWLRTLARHGVVRQDGEVFRLLKDAVEMPQFDDNADKLRTLREKKKQAALNALAVASQAIEQARAAVTEL